MPVDEIGRTVLFNKLHKTFKAFVAWILSVVYMTGRGMGDYNMRRSIAPERKAHSAEKALHLLFTVLIHPSIIPSTTGEADKCAAVEVDNAAVNIVTP